MRWTSLDKGVDKWFVKKQWQKWFAWYPVIIAKEFPGRSVRRHYVWFEWIERKGLSRHITGGWSYDYRPLSNI